jgi:hypothetical protein
VYWAKQIDRCDRGEQLMRSHKSKVETRAVLANLNSVLDDSGVSRDDLAKHLGLSLNGLESKLAGRKHLTIPDVGMMWAATGIKPTVLLYGIN